ncbi:MAG: hypothetical protein OQJ78_10490 [Ignavibacteriaceae bacterium]|nr:hypothetical protein [Ignavibacteriaceae bacterium]
MRHKTHYLCYPFHIAEWIVIAVLLFNPIATAQESIPTEEFYIGTKLGNKPYKIKETFNSFLECGFNSIWWNAYSDTKPYLDKFNKPFLAENGRGRKDYIHHYATSYYSRWEAEQNQNRNRVGIKHKFGQIANWRGFKCWSTIGLSSSAESLIYGPHYRQDKRYKRWLYDELGWSRYNVNYNVRFKMALSYKSESVSQDEDVCLIKVVYRYIREYPGGWDPPEDLILLQKSLKVKDFLQDGNFKYIYFDKTYRYPEKFQIPELDFTKQTKYTYNDTEAGLGIQFQVDWLRNNDYCTLYVDNIEVYDNDGWNDIIKNSKETVKKIKKYAERFSDWLYLKYWYVHDEPYSIDAFMPYHIVDSIVTETTGVPLITEFYPYWTHDGKINGDDFLQAWYEIAKPQKLMIDYYPFSPDYPFRLVDTEALRLRFQKCHTLQPGFWYSAQAFGAKVNGDWKVWRMPNNAEFTASIMLGLAHGMKGIMLFSYDSFGEIIGLVANDRTNFSKSNLWYLLKNSLIPRLKGTLGRKLMELNYTGNYLQYFKIGKVQNKPSVQKTQDDFLTLGFNQTQSVEMNWHCGLFNRPEHPEDKYIFLANLYTAADSRAINIQVKESGNKYKNYRFRNIEDKLDTTFTGEFSIKLTQLGGEGYLYQIAPVIKYGGKLLYSEETEDGNELDEDMIIDMGAVLTVNGNYFSKANIIVKKGNVIYRNNGKIHFDANKKLLTN